jgi:hypothetical protein
VDAAGVLAGMQDFSRTQQVSAEEALALESVRAFIAARHWNSIIPVAPGTDTLSAALTAAAALLPSFKNRILLYLPNGTYNQTVSVDCLAWVDIVGESTDGVNIRTAANIDVIKLYNDESLLAKFNVVCDVTPAPDAKYPIHIDLGAGTIHGTTMILWGVKATSSNGNKSGVGVGIAAKQRLYLVDCEFVAEATAVAGTAGLFAHNGYTAQAATAYIAILNCVCTSATAGGDGFAWQSQGSTQTDLVQVVGGVFTGGAGGHGISEANAVNGAAEAFVSISDSVDATEDFAHQACRLNLPPGIPIPPAYAAHLTQYLGTVQPGNDTGRWDVNGTIYGYGAEIIARNTSTTGAFAWNLVTANNHAKYATEGSAGGANFTGASPYATAYGSKFNYPVQCFQNDVLRWSITSTQFTATLPIGAAAYAKSSRPTVTTPGVQIFQTDNTPGPRWWDGSHWITAAGVSDD